ncbi:MAG TPA: hypothetical protein VGL58_00785 [Caulobacteraceae bacterium]|jgi:hypothetical protein
MTYANHEVVAADPAPTRDGWIARQIVRLDAKLRSGHGVIEFRGTKASILRVAIVPAEADFCLASGVRVAKGDPVIELHFWNERLPQTSDNAGLAWAAKFGRQLLVSFRELATGLQVDPRLADCKVVLARLAFASERNRGDTQRFGVKFGFETLPVPWKVPLARKIHDFGEDLWLVGLTWVFNPGSLKGRSVLRLREDLWMSRESLIGRYGDKPARAPAEPESPSVAAPVSDATRAA